MQTIILLSGWAGSGKDHVADLLELHFLFKKTSFAIHLKNTVSSLYGIDRSKLDTQSGKKTLYNNSLTYRDILIDYAESKRKSDINYWSSFVLSEIQNSNSDFVISDWRFPVEYTFLQYHLPTCRFITIRINRLLINNIDSYTEHALDNFNFDYTLNNFEGTSNDSLIQNLQRIL
jgi:hypothetical protein